MVYNTCIYVIVSACFIVKLMVLWGFFDRSLHYRAVETYRQFDY